MSGFLCHSCPKFVLFRSFVGSKEKEDDCTEQENDQQQGQWIVL
jgi:hypothetical protein